jgi:biopolymer transport protein ExbD
MKAGGGGEDEPVTDINITPLVDVTLVLVIILMVTAPMISQSDLKVTIPKAVTDEAKSEDRVTVTIDKDGKMAVNEKPVVTGAELEQWTSVKLEKSTDKVVVIKADEVVDEGVVLDALDNIKKAKPKKVYFATMQKEKTKSK